MMKYFNSRIIQIVAIILVLLGTGWFLISPPGTFVPDKTVNIPNGYGSYATAKLMKNEGLARSSVLLHVIFRLIGGESRIQAGDYLFAKPVSVIRLAKVIVRGEYGFVPRKITLPEGLTRFEMADILSNNLINFDKNEFIELSESKEGYLFPDTYLIMPTATSGQVIDLLTSTFESRIQESSYEIASFNKPLKDIMIMASIVEEEGKDEKSRQIIAGILWRRIELGMPLQVDATFRYINGKTSKDLTLEDLKIDSPYNTYKYKGLPPAPIANPGIESIRATVIPIKTPYIYFLTGDDGEMYYAKNLTEHAENKRKYIKN